MNITCYIFCTVLWHALRFRQIVGRRRGRNLWFCFYRRRQIELWQLLRAVFATGSIRRHRSIGQRKTYCVCIADINSDWQKL